MLLILRQAQDGRVVTSGWRCITPKDGEVDDEGWQSGDLGMAKWCDEGWQGLADNFKFANCLSGGIIDIANQSR